MRSVVLAAGCLFLASGVFAQVTAGAMPVTPGYYTNSNDAISAYTYVNLGHPATANGTLTTAAVRWTNATCSNAYRLKFLRLSNGQANYTVIADRGPFNIATGINVVTLSPSAAVQKGDLIAITQLAPLNPCGGFFLSETTARAASMRFNGEIPSSGTMNGSVIPGTIPHVRASSDTNILEAVLPAAGSLAGGFGSFFRTAVQVFNWDQKPMTGKFVFHQAGRAASASDPSLAYTLAGFEVKKYDDIVDAMGQSGLGTLDLVSTSGGRPQVVTRVFNDTPGGTAGFNEELLSKDEAVNQFAPVAILMPADVSNFRMNIGIRTFEAGATISISAPGVSSLTKVYVANYFEQKGLQDFLNGVAPTANGLLSIQIQSGSAIIYASTTDNRTNDSSIWFARRE